VGRGGIINMRKQRNQKQMWIPVYIVAGDTNVADTDTTTRPPLDQDHN
jgi:hypothetical protein